MPLIEWGDNFSVGHAEIDAQHQRWIEIHNKLHTILLGSQALDVKSSTLTTLEAMKDYAMSHFAFEEKYLQEIGYPERDAHALIHRAFEKTVSSYLDKLLEGTIVLNSEIIRILKCWLEHHILDEDMKYARFVSG